MLIGNTILIGILRTPGDVAAHLPSPALFIGIWIVGGLYALLGAMSLAEPGAMPVASSGWARRTRTKACSIRRRHGCRPRGP